MSTRIEAARAAAIAALTVAGGWEDTAVDMVTADADEVRHMARTIAAIASGDPGGIDARALSYVTALLTTMTEPEATPADVVPVRIFGVDPSKAERLTRYRCVLVVAHPSSGQGDIERWAHAMLAAEKEPAS